MATSRWFPSDWIDRKEKSKKKILSFLLLLLEVYIFSRREGGKKIDPSLCLCRALTPDLLGLEKGKGEREDDASRVEPSRAEPSRVESSRFPLPFLLFFFEIFFPTNQSISRHSMAGGSARKCVVSNRRPRFSFLSWTSVECALLTDERERLHEWMPSTITAIAATAILIRCFVWHRRRRCRRQWQLIRQNQVKNAKRKRPAQFFQLFTFQLWIVLSDWRIASLQVAAHVKSFF